MSRDVLNFFSKIPEQASTSWNTTKIIQFRISRRETILTFERHVGRYGHEISTTIPKLTVTIIVYTRLRVFATTIIITPVRWLTRDWQHDIRSSFARRRATDRGTSWKCQLNEYRPEWCKCESRWETRTYTTVSKCCSALSKNPDVWRSRRARGDFALGHSSGSHSVNTGNGTQYEYRYRPSTRNECSSKFHNRPYGKIKKNNNKNVWRAPKHNCAHRKYRAIRGLWPPSGVFYFFSLSSADPKRTNN